MAKFSGKGAEFQVRTTVSPEAFVTVAQVAEIGSISVTSEEIDVTTLDDNQSGQSTDYKDFLQGFKDPGELPLRVIFDPNIATHGSLPNGLYALFNAGQTITARVKFPTSPVNYLRATGFFRDWETPAFNASDPVESTFTMRLGGRPTLGLT